MYVRHLGLRDFRSWPEADLDVEPGRTVFVGPNGYGKTNLVEALWYLSTLGSHRVATDAPLVRSGKPRAVVSTIVVNEGRELAVDLEITPGKANKARLNRSPVRSPREILGVLRAVLFAPEDLSLVRVIRVSAADTLTNWRLCADLHWLRCGPTTTASCGSGPRY